MLSCVCVCIAAYPSTPNCGDSSDCVSFLLFRHRFNEHKMSIFMQLSSPSSLSSHSSSYCSISSFIHLSIDGASDLTFYHFLGHRNVCVCVRATFFIDNRTFIDFSIYLVDLDLLVRRHFFSSLINWRIDCDIVLPFLASARLNYARVCMCVCMYVGNTVIAQR